MGKKIYAKAINKEGKELQISSIQFSIDNLKSCSLQQDLYIDAIDEFGQHVLIYPNDWNFLFETKYGEKECNKCNDLLN